MAVDLKAIQPLLMTAFEPSWQIGADGIYAISPDQTFAVEVRESASQLIIMTSINPQHSAYFARNKLLAKVLLSKVLGPWAGDRVNNAEPGEFVIEQGGLIVAHHPLLLAISFAAGGSAP